MPALLLTSDNFPQALGVPADGRVEFDWDELLWAAITVGRRELDHVVRHGTYSLYEIAYRTALLWANLRERDDGLLGRSAAYDGLDPSEKSAISYFVGLSVTKLLVSRFLNVHWLLHLDVYRDQLGLDVATGGRPDLLGIDMQDRWVVVEAKGRTNGFDGKALARAKEQSGYVVSVGGVPPHLSVGLLSFFAREGLTVAWEDPPSREDERSIRLELDPERVKATYYRPFHSMLQETEIGRRRVAIGGGRMASTTYMPELDVEVGLVEDLGPQPGAPPLDAGQAFEGPDGVVVRVGGRWNSAQMMLEPQSRQ